MSTEDYYDDHTTYDEQIRELDFARESDGRQSMSSQAKNKDQKNLMKGDLNAGLDLNTSTASMSFAPDADSRSAHTPLQIVFIDRTVCFTYGHMEVKTL